MTHDEMKQRRKEAAQRRRRIIFNSDAGDTDPPELKVADPEEYLKSRKTGLVGSSVDSIFYSTAQGFDQYVHYSEVSEIAYHANPVIGQMLEQGHDPLQLTVEFCRKNDIEILWSFRINDEHDSWSPELVSQFKKDHPEYLLGTREKPPPHGPWSAVDYAQPEVREYVFGHLQDVCSRYDVDGIEFDFFRQLTCFKSLAWGKQVSQEERDTMTELLGRVREMMDEIGRNRQRPLLIAARVPDSLGYCQALGFDLLRWLQEDLIDIMVVGGYFWLQPWERSVELGHRFDVPVYPSLDGSRIGRDPWVPGYKEPHSDIECLKVRRSDEAYQAHALRAWNAGADGIYLFNFNYLRPPSHRLWTDLGDPKRLATLDKLYHVSVMGHGGPPLQGYLPGGQGDRFFHLPILSPGSPRELVPRVPLVTTLDVADDVKWAKDEGLEPELKLNVQVENLPRADGLSVALNGQALGKAPLSWESQFPQMWQEYTVDPQQVSKGHNNLEITLTEDVRDETPCVLHDLHLRIQMRKDTR